MLAFFVLVLAVCLLPVAAEDQLLSWETNQEYYLAMERGFRLDATPHHAHFVDQGK